MAILLRSPSNKAESYAKEFARLNVPLLVERGGFYESLEILDLLSLFQLLDNPLQDLPAIAVLHSPLVGLTLNELATIRLAAKGPFWTALARWAESPKSEASTGHKVATFLDRFARWRRLARQTSLSRCLETVLSETHYSAWVLTQSRGQQRHANVQRFMGLARQFDQFQRQGLFRFLLFIEAQKSAETEPEVAAVSGENSVRLMSIHQSKGLEFPVVVVADLGKPFNTSDLRAEVILDEEYGLCPQIKPPHTGKRYPSLPYWLARQRQHREMLGEELRLLYVAATRARDTLILSGAVSKPRFEKVWKQQGELSTQRLLSARSYSDWLGVWFSRNTSTDDDTATEGRNAHLRWVVHDDTTLIGPGAEPTNGESDPALAVRPAVWQELQRRLSWEYPFSAATREPAKTSVSILRRRATEDLDEPSVPRLSFQGSNLKVQTSAFVRDSIPMRSGRPSASDVGTAHHKFLQLVSLKRLGGSDELKSEAERLLKGGAITAEENAVLDFEGLAAFWQSELGQQVQANARHVERELAFTVRCAANEIARLAGQPPGAELEDEFVIVQGAADLVVLLPHEIWLIDFKTDAVGQDDLTDKVKLYEPQLNLYVRALSGIYGRPVSQTWLYFLAVRRAVAIKAAN
jgi:ATP-dependent helicase/nuclease subunit A